MGNIRTKDEAADEKTVPALQSSNEQIAIIKTDLCLNDEELHAIYKSFAKFDKRQNGFLELDDFVAPFQEDDEDFVELPYLEQFFRLIQKKRRNKVFFEEFIPSIVSFCLMNGESILRFVFDWIDTDGDERISEKDVAESACYRNPRTGGHTFFVNYVTEIEKSQLNAKMSKNEAKIKKMDFEKFRLYTLKVPFLIWPAFRFQQRLRNLIIGSQFWRKLYLRIEASQTALKNNEKKFQKIREKTDLLRNLQRKQPQHRKMGKHTYKMRSPGMISTDMCLEPHLVHHRRKSCPYLKPDLSQISSDSSDKLD